MTFELSQEHETFRKVVRDFAEREVAPHVAQWDREHHFPIDIVQAMGELGFFGLVVPEEFGGSAADFTSLCVAIEELGVARCLLAYRPRVQRFAAHAETVHEVGTGRRDIPVQRH